MPNIMDIKKDDTWTRGTWANNPLPSVRGAGSSLPSTNNAFLPEWFQGHSSTATKKTKPKTSVQKTASQARNADEGMRWGGIFAHVRRVQDDKKAQKAQESSKPQLYQGLYQGLYQPEDPGRRFEGSKCHRRETLRSQSRTFPDYLTQGGTGMSEHRAYAQAGKKDKAGQQETPFDMNEFFQNLLTQSPGRTPTPEGGSGIQDVLSQFQEAMQGNVDSRMQHANQLMGAMQGWFNKANQEAAKYDFRADAAWRDFGRGGGGRLNRGDVRKRGAAHRRATSAQRKAKNIRDFWQGGAGGEATLKKAAFDAMSGFLTQAAPSMINRTSSDWESVLNANVQGDRTDAMNRGHTLNALTSLATKQMGAQGTQGSSPFDILAESLAKGMGKQTGESMALDSAEIPDAGIDEVMKLINRILGGSGDAEITPQMIELLKGMQS